MNIHTFGDSHASREHSQWGFHNMSNIKDNNLGPKLMYTFGSKRLGFCNIKLPKYQVKENDIVIFCFGEIDCRCHVHKHINSVRTYKDIINELVENYFKAIKQNVEQYNNLFVCVYNVVPPLYTTIEGHPQFPFLGTNEERREYTKYMNNQLKRLCEVHNYYFFDIYEQSCNKNGFIERSYTDSCGIHLRHTKDAKVVINDIIKKAKQKLIK